MKASRTRNSTNDDEACTGILFSAERGHLVLGSWQCDLEASEWWEIGEGLSVKKFTIGNKFLVSVGPGRPTGEGRLFADSQATFIWLCSENGDGVDVT